MKKTIISIVALAALAVVAQVNITPNPTSPGDLGASTNRFPNLYASNAALGSLSVTGAVTAGSFSRSGIVAGLTNNLAGFTNYQYAPNYDEVTNIVTTAINESDSIFATDDGTNITLNLDKPLVIETNVTITGTLTTTGRTNLIPGFITLYGTAVTNYAASTLTTANYVEPGSWFGPDFDVSTNAVEYAFAVPPGAKTNVLEVVIQYVRSNTNPAGGAASNVVWGLLASSLDGNSVATATSPTLYTTNGVRSGNGAYIDYVVYNYSTQAALLTNNTIRVHLARSGLNASDNYTGFVSVPNVFLRYLQE
jgi:hypothetical protein